MTATNSEKTIAAQAYFNNSSLQKDHATELLGMLSVPLGASVLDLGCGTGYLATLLSEIVGPNGKVTAVDPDAERIALAKKINSRPNIYYSVADSETFPGVNYDLIVSTHVIHWIKDKQALFNRIASKLSENGMFGFVTYDGSPDLTWPDVIQQALATLVSPDFFVDLMYKRITYEKKEKYVEWATNAGLAVMENEVFPKIFQFESLQGFIEFWSGVSHGTFIAEDVDQNKLLEFQKCHESELLKSVLDFPTLCMVIQK